MKTSEARSRAEIGPGDVAGARTALLRAVRLFEGDEEVSHLLAGAESALAHLGIVIEEEDVAQEELPRVA